MDRLFTKPLARTILWLGLGTALGAAAVGGLWYARSGALPDRALIAPAPPEILPPPPSPSPAPAPGPVPGPLPTLPSIPLPAPLGAAPPPLESQAPEPPSRTPEPIGEFFGFPVETLERATGPQLQPRPLPRPPQPPAPTPASAPSPPVAVRLLAMPGKCVAGFDGTSTLHDFRGWTKSVTGWIEFEPGRIDATAQAAFTVDARTLDTGDQDRDQAMHGEHLESARYPEMKFKLSGFHSTPGGSCAIRGTLEIHGQSRTVEMAATFEVRPDGIVHVKGQGNAKMSDFGITPPSKVLVIRTADEIKVWFEAWAAPQGGSK
jgi:polyisoprenoid-binding protein YceI